MIIESCVEHITDPQRQKNHVYPENKKNKRHVSYRRLAAIGLVLIMNELLKFGIFLVVPVFLSASLASCGDPRGRLDHRSSPGDVLVRQLLGQELLDAGDDVLGHIPDAFDPDANGYFTSTKLGIVLGKLCPHMGIALKPSVV